MPFNYEFARPALTVDIVVFALDADDLKVMLIERDLKPFAGRWALPGGFVRVEQLYTFGALKRDPRERVVTVAYFALVNLEGHRVQASTDARNAAWFAVSDLPDLAFDHQQILDTALERLRGKLRYQPVGFELLPKKFPLRSLQHLYEVVLDRELDKRNFRKKILSMDILVELKEIEKDVAHRAAKLYRFDKAKYDRKTRGGFNFEI